MIWKQEFTIEGLTNTGAACLPGHMGIKFLEYGDDYLKASMPVAPHNKQPMGLLHGGASVVLAETLGSVASILTIEDLEKKTSVGVEINANHLTAARSGLVYGTVKPYKLGRKLQVWNIEIRNEADKLICVSRLTTAIIDRII